MSSKRPVNLFVWNHQFFWENCIKLTFSGCPRKFYHRVMYIAPSSGHISLNFIMPLKLILRRFGLFSDVWSKHAALFERLMEIHSNPPILYYCINPLKMVLSFGKISESICWYLISFPNIIKSLSWQQVNDNVLTSTAYCGLGKQIQIHIPFIITWCILNLFILWYWEVEFCWSVGINCHQKLLSDSDSELNHHDNRTTQTGPDLGEGRVGSCPGAPRKRGPQQILIIPFEYHCA